MKAKSLAELADIRAALRQRALAQQAAAWAAEERKAAMDRERRQFEHAVGPVTPLPDKRLLPPPTPQVLPRPAQRERDEAAVMQEAWSDDFDVETLLHTDEALSYRAPPLGAGVLRKLRQGDWSIQRHIDLHGLRTDEAREALGKFLREAHLQGIRCVRVVHGKGLGSPGGTPVLKGRVLRWLVQKKEVMAFVQARVADGGAGALVVLLASGGRLPR